MNFMSVNLPYPTSSLVDVLSILEVANDPVKLKKLIKELQLASVEFSDQKLLCEQKLIDLEKQNNELEKNILKLEQIKIVSDESKKSSDISLKEFKAKKEELLKLGESLEMNTKALDNRQASLEHEHNKKIEALAAKEAEALKAKEASEKIGAEFKDKLEKFKALTA